MEILLDPSIWIGLLTLVILEIVLGIDNLVFIWTGPKYHRTASIT